MSGPSLVSSRLQSLVFPLEMNSVCQRKEKLLWDLLSFCKTELALLPQPAAMELLLCFVFRLTQ